MISRERSCRRKLRHLNYLEALHHAAKVPRNETVVIYPCAYCAGLHVGHSATTPEADLLMRIARTERRIAQTKMAIENASSLTQEEVQRHRQRLRDLCAHVGRLKSTTKAIPSAPKSSEPLTA